MDDVGGDDDVQYDSKNVFVVQASASSAFVNIVYRLRLGNVRVERRLAAWSNERKG